MKAESESDEDHQRKFILNLFANNGGGAADNVVDDDHELDDEITEHIWTCCPDAHDDAGRADAPPPVVAIHYHLAFRTSGHGNRLWNSSDCIARQLILPECRAAMLLFDDGSDATTEGGNGSGTRKRRRRPPFRWPPKRCVEFGAGSALPSLALLREGAGRVVITDRHVNSDATFDALRMSVERNAKYRRTTASSDGGGGVGGRAVVVPHTWGEDVDGLLTHIGGGEDDENDREAAAATTSSTTRKADLLVASDCIYNPACHDALLRSATGVMDPERGLFVVGYSLHGNVPSSRISAFFDAARRDYGLDVVNEFSRRYEGGQRGIGSEDAERGAVYVKVLAWGERGGPPTPAG